MRSLPTYPFSDQASGHALSLPTTNQPTRKHEQEMPEEDQLKSNSEFKPNLVNSVCYLVEASVQLSTFGVNYVGHPFNISIRRVPPFPLLPSSLVAQFPCCLARLLPSSLVA